MVSSDGRVEQEEREKMQIIECQIELAIEKLGGQLSPKRKEGLQRMSVEELTRTAKGVAGAKSPEEAIGLIVNDITDSDHARRAVEQKRFDELGGCPAKISMDL